VKEIDLEQLGSVSGGFRWQDLRPSTNVEDRRGWTERQQRNAPVEVFWPPGPGPRSPGDLASQAGYDDIGPLADRLRQQSRRRR
jgi:hypothetical protein